MSSATDRTPLHQTTGAKIGIAVFLLLTFVYAILIAQQILLWVFLALGVVVLWYAARLVVAFEQIARHLGDIAAAQSDATTSPDDAGDD
ncbi:hypothetical protein C455_01197 [Haloferax larsenii JCM 13917]|nr:hypothetical protein [Haloferax larsenii]ELZ84276.1 hypothetical protein C455_01197 [Haloferax larsenii JCM 13917]